MYPTAVVLYVDEPGVESVADDAGLGVRGPVGRADRDRRRDRDSREHLFHDSLDGNEHFGAEWRVEFGLDAVDRVDVDLWVVDHPEECLAERQGILVRKEPYI